MTACAAGQSCLAVAAEKRSRTGSVAALGALSPAARANIGVSNAAMIRIGAFMVDSLVRVLLTATLTLVAAPAFPQALNSREEALAALGSPDAARRAEGVLWIARRGAPGDDTPLYERLRDETPIVRSFAEQALWMVWSRSGDAAVDRLMERGVEA